MIILIENLQDFHYEIIESVIVKYDKIIALLIEAIKDLKAEINELKGGN